MSVSDISGDRTIYHKTGKKGKSNPITLAGDRFNPQIKIRQGKPSSSEILYKSFLNQENDFLSRLESLKTWAQNASPQAISSAMKELKTQLHKLNIRDFTEWTSIMENLVWLFQINISRKLKDPILTMMKDKLFLLGKFPSRADFFTWYHAYRNKRNIGHMIIDNFHQPINTTYIERIKEDTFKSILTKIHQLYNMKKRQQYHVRNPEVLHKISSMIKELLMQYVRNIRDNDSMSAQKKIQQLDKLNSNDPIITRAIQQLRKQLPRQELPGQQLPGQQLPGQQLPGQQLRKQLPRQQLPRQQLPGQQLPGQQLSRQQLRRQLHGQPRTISTLRPQQTTIRRPQRSHEPLENPGGDFNMWTSRRIVDNMPL
jgi:hypothetical protein